MKFFYFTLLSLIGLSVHAQVFKISGTIIEKETNSKLTGVSVYLEGTNIGSISDTNGNYIIDNVDKGTYILVARFIGYDLKKFAITLNSDVNLDFILSENFTEISGITIRGTSITGGSGGINDMPGSAHYISPKALEKNSYNDINRILRSVPGVNIQEEDGFGLRPNIGLRGTGVERSSKITLMEDGILVAPAPYAAPSAYYFPTVGRMQGIEVRKGSSQIKYGPYTTGGAINFISTPIPKSRSGRVNLIGGSYGQRLLHANIGQSFKNVGFIVETYQASADGFKVLDNGGNTGFDTKDFLSKIRFNTNADAKIYQAITFKIGQTKGLSNETYLGLTQQDFENDPFRRYAGSSEDLMDTEQIQFSAQHLIRPLKFMDITSTFYRTEFDRNWYKLDKVGGVGIGNILDNPNGNLGAYNTILGFGSDTLGVKANNRAYYSQGFQSIVGLQFKNSVANHDIEIGLRVHTDQMDRFQWVDDYTIDNGNLRLINSGTPGTESNRIESADAFASFVQYTLNINNFTFIPGLRYEKISMRKVDYGKSDAIRSGTELKINENDVEVWIPGFGLDYQLNDAMSIFGGIHRGFSPPGANEGTKPEKSVSYELGTRLNKKAISINTALFINDYSNLLGSDLAAAGGLGTTDQFNGGEVLVKGVELYLTYDLLFGNSNGFSLPLSLIYTHTDAEFQSSFDSDFDGWGTGVERGDELPYIAKNQLAINANFESKLFDFTVSSKYVGDMRTTAGKGDIALENRIDSQLIIDLSTNIFLTKYLSLFASARNITDQVYLVSRRPAGLRPGMPRNFQIGIKAML